MTMLDKLRRQVDVLEREALDACETDREEDMILRCGRGDTRCFLGMTERFDSSEHSKFYEACVALAEAEKRELKAAFAQNA